jgi:hypothetical protein
MGLSGKKGQPLLLVWRRHGFYRHLIIFRFFGNTIAYLLERFIFWQDAQGVHSALRKKTQAAKNCDPQTQEEAKKK